MLSRAEMLNYRASRPRFKAYDTLKALKLQKGAVVADIGSGGGYFTNLFAAAVGSHGTVYAVDANPGLLAHVQRKAKENRLSNVKTVLLQNGVLALPERGCDLIFLRNVFHHLEQPVPYFRNLKRFLKPGGRVAVIDYRKRRALGFSALMGHHTEEAVILETAAKAGFVPFARYDFLPDQSFNIFQAP